MSKLDILWGRISLWLMSAPLNIMIKVGMIPKRKVYILNVVYIKEMLK